ncbi:MAG TPA: UDP-N-acetylmuramoyl-tripeptide--D-alanyl-D-alanine ligase [Gemmatimonadaceae bacterium]|nr:UDP-N-acetylmuramoyl-tripeptide--D-alanyl-D-alanine ligase [Gemmatimonadaceae bacterium]
MTFWSLDRVASALGTGPRGPQTLSGVSTDTRTAGAGALFVALAGEHYDAHDFLGAAVERGVGALVVSRLPRERLGVPVYEVPNTLAALGALARYRRRTWGKPVIAIAGSNGKTSTKDLVRCALGAILEVHATSGNLNNQIGVPLTLLSVPDSADVAVIEMGTNYPGEIPILRDIAEPDMAIVTSIGEEHLEGFHDLAGVLAEESSVLDGTRLGIIPIVESDLVNVARRRAHHIVTVGLDDGDLRAESYDVGTSTIRFRGVPVTVPLHGAHNLRNAMLALAAADACGLTAEQAAAGIARTPAPAMRSAVTALGQRGATLINDAYNANPASMRAAFEMLAATGAGRQRVVVLGTMRELGANSSQLHSDVARRALAGPFDIIAGIGDLGAALRAVADTDPRVITGNDVEDLWSDLRPRLRPDAVILIKASRGVKLERLVPYLTDWATT